MISRPALTIIHPDQGYPMAAFRYITTPADSQRA